MDEHLTYNKPTATDEDSDDKLQIGSVSARHATIMNYYGHNSLLMFITQCSNKASKLFFKLQQLQSKAQEFCESSLLPKVTCAGKNTDLIK